MVISSYAGYWAGKNVQSMGVLRSDCILDFGAFEIGRNGPKLAKQAVYVKILIWNLSWIFTAEIQLHLSILVGHILKSYYYLSSTINMW